MILDLRIKINVSDIRWLISCVSAMVETYSLVLIICGAAIPSWCSSHPCLIFCYPFKEETILLYCAQNAFYLCICLLELNTFQYVLNRMNNRIFIVPLAPPN